MQYGQRKLHRSMTEMRKSCKGRPSRSSGFCAPRMSWITLLMDGRSPAVHAGDEALGVGVGPGRQFHEAVGARETQKIARSVRRPRSRPRATPVIMLDRHRQEIRERVLEGYGTRQCESLGWRAFGPHGFGDRRNDVADQAHQGRDWIAWQAKDRLALRPDAEPHGPARPLCDIVKDLLHA